MIKPEPIRLNLHIQFQAQMPSLATTLAHNWRLYFIIIHLLLLNHTSGCFPFLLPLLSLPPFHPGSFPHLCNWENLRFSDIYCKTRCDCLSQFQQHQWYEDVMSPFHIWKTIVVQTFQTCLHTVIDILTRRAHKWNEQNCVATWSWWTLSFKAAINIPANI